MKISMYSSIDHNLCGLTVLSTSKHTKCDMQCVSVQENMSMRLRKVIIEYNVYIQKFHAFSARPK